MFKPPARRESSIEASVCQWAKKNNIIALKLQGSGLKGYPDRIFLLPGGTICFIEFKAAGKKPTKLQEHSHEQLRNRGFDVYVCDSRASAIEALQCCLDAPPISDQDG